jgi:mannose-6-phosphate isomerase-like protein (cupin superfamily)
MSTIIANAGVVTPLSFVVEAGQARSGQVYRFLGETIVLKCSGADTRGRFGIVEEITPPLSGPPLHQHSVEDEWLYILEGEYRVQIGEEIIFVRAGDSLFAPRDIPHTFQNISSKPSRLLGIAQPAGGMENFFGEMVIACANGQPDPAQLVPIFEKYGLLLLGPPPAVMETGRMSATDRQK